MTNHVGTFDATFGYQNDGPAVATIPVGPANRFSPAPEGRGQTTAFNPGNVQKAFTVRGIPAGTNLVWTLTSATSSFGSARATWFSPAAIEASHAYRKLEVQNRTAAAALLSIDS